MAALITFACLLVTILLPTFGELESSTVGLTTREIKADVTTTSSDELLEAQTKTHTTVQGTTEEVNRSPPVPFVLSLGNISSSPETPTDVVLYKANLQPSDLHCVAFYVDSTIIGVVVQINGGQVMDVFVQGRNASGKDTWTLQENDYGLTALKIQQPRPGIHVIKIHPYNEDKNDTVPTAASSSASDASDCPAVGILSTPPTQAATTTYATTATATTTTTSDSFVEVTPAGNEVEEGIADNAIDTATKNATDNIDVSAATRVDAVVEIVDNDVVLEITVVGYSKLNVVMNFVNPATMVMLAGPPIAGDIIYVLSELISLADISSISHLLVYSPQGEIDDTIEYRISNLNPSLLLFYLITPGKPFFLAIEGYDNEGYKFQRFMPDLVEPSTIALSFSTATSMDLSPNETLHIQMKLRNAGQADNFTILAEFDTYMDYLTASVLPNDTWIDAGETVPIDIYVNVHESISQSINSDLEITVTRCSNDDSVSLSRLIVATPTSFFEDNEPPTCTVVASFNTCGTGVDDEFWWVFTAVTDYSGVYRVTFPEEEGDGVLQSRITFKTVDGKILVDALYVHDCQSFDYTVNVEDYIGNEDTCTLDMSLYPYQTASSSPEALSDTVPGDVADGVDPTNGSPSGSQTTSSQEVDPWSWLDNSNTTWTNGGSNTNIWTFIGDNAKATLILIAALSLATACALIFAMRSCVRSERNPPPRRKVAFRFGRSQKVQITGYDGGKSDTLDSTVQIQMREIRSHARADKTETAGDNPNTIAAVGFLTHSCIENKEQKMARGDSNGNASCSSGQADSELTLPSTSSSKRDEAYGSLRSSVRKRHTHRGSLQKVVPHLSGGNSELNSTDGAPDPNNDSGRDGEQGSNCNMVKWLAEVGAMDFEPKNKAEIYNSIMQFRDTLERLEQRRNILVGNLMDADGGLRDLDRRDSQTEEGDADISPSPSDDGMEGDNPEVVAIGGISSAEEGRINKAFTGDAGEGKGSKTSLAEDKEPKSYTLLPQGASGTSAPLGQVDVGMLIEGATQVSLRHEIERLRGRFLQCCKDVEEALRREQDIYEGLSDVSLEDADSDFEEMEM